MPASIPLLAPALATVAILLIAAGAIWWSTRSVRRANEMVLRTTSELQVSEDRYHRFFNESPVALYRTSPDGAILDANIALAELLGYDSPKELVGVSARAHHANPAARDEFRLIMDQSRVVESHSTELRRRDGTTFWVVDTTVAVRGSDGKVLHYEGCLVDITEGRASEEKLAASERRFRALIEQSADGIALLSRDGVVQYTSSSTDQLLGVPDEPRIGRLFQEYVHPDDVAVANAVFGEAVATPGIVVRSVVRGRHADGGWRTIEWSAVNRLDDADVGAIVVNFRDVTRLHRSEGAG